MDKVESIYLPQMQNGEVVAFHDDSVEEIKKANVSRWFPESVDRYNQSVIHMKLTLDVFQASELSPTSYTLDRRRDKSWSNFKAYVKVCMNDEDDDQEKEAAAERVMFIIRNAEGDVGNPLLLGVAKESTAIDSILRSLEPAADDIELIGATRRLEKVAEANAVFKSFQIGRDTETSGKPSGDMKAARAVAREAYKEVIADINARIRLFKDEELMAFAKIHNATIKKHLNLVALRKGHGGKGDSSKPEE